MIFSKFIKLITHFVRYPVDIMLWPVSVLFGWLHGIIKIYALLTLNEVCYSLILHAQLLISSQTTWGSRAGADADNKDRMIRGNRTPFRPEYQYFYEDNDEKIPLREDMISYETRLSAVAA
jgi:hypothetical protein